MKYPNLNTQDIYLQFIKEYREREKNKNQNVFYYSVLKRWFQLYIKSDIFLFLCVVFIGIIICYILDKYQILKYFFGLWIFISILFSMQHFNNQFSVEEKSVAYQIIRSIMKKKKIKNTITSLEILIRSCNEIGEPNLQFVKFIKNDCFYKFLIQSFVGMLGFFTGILSSNLLKGEFNSNMDIFITLTKITQILIIVCFLFYSTFYPLFMRLNRGVNLYIQVLKDMKNTLEMSYKG